MTRYDDEMNRPSPRQLYRVREGAKLFGVFSGIADYFGFKKGATQLVGFILCFSMPIFIFVYFALGFILKERPTNLYPNQNMERMWRSYRKSPVGTLDELKHRFRSMDSRLQKMERYVTSRRYQLDDDFESLK